MYRFSSYFHCLLLNHDVTKSHETITLAAIAMIAGIWISAVTQHSKVRSGDARFRSVGNHTTVSRWRTHFYRWSASERGCTTCRIWCACAAGKWKPPICRSSVPVGAPSGARKSLHIFSAKCGYSWKWRSAKSSSSCKIACNGFLKSDDAGSRLLLQHSLAIARFYNLHRL